MNGQGIRRGYLHDDFRLFHLKDTHTRQVEPHYHDFDKIVVLLQGQVTYMVEGMTYFLRPGDMVLVPRWLSHRLTADPAEPYERIVIYLGRDYLLLRSDGETPLERCFETVRERGFHLLRPADPAFYAALLKQLEENLQGRDFGAKRMSDLLCQQLLISVSRDVFSSQTAIDAPESYRADRKMEEILQYIGEHLQEELSVDTLASRFYISRYYLMHRFKAVTGYSLHQYIGRRRTLAAAELLRSGASVTAAAEQAGFREYSTFLRSFRAMVHMSPREYRERA